MAISLIRMFKDGPEVSLRGSPTVSPMTAALCCSDFFYLTIPFWSLNLPDSMYFLVLSQAPPVLLIEVASWTPETKVPGNSPQSKSGWKKTPKKSGVRITKRPGGIISLKEAAVDTAMHLLKSGS